jgi:hypothetical protein
VSAAVARTHQCEATCVPLVVVEMVHPAQPHRRMATCRGISHLSVRDPAHPVWSTPGRASTSDPGPAERLVAVSLAPALLTEEAVASSSGGGSP